MPPSALSDLNLRVGVSGFSRILTCHLRRSSNDKRRGKTDANPRKLKNDGALAAILNSKAHLDAINSIRFIDTLRYLKKVIVREISPF